MTACILAATAGTKARLTNPNEGSDLLGLNANSNYLQGLKMILSPSLSLPLSIPPSLPLLLTPTFFLSSSFIILSLSLSLCF